MSFGITAAAWGAIGAVGGAAIAANGARRAGQTQADAADRATDSQWRMYNQNREDSEPWRTAGRNVLPQLSAGLEEGGKFNRDFTMDDFQKDPGYDFRLQEGMKAVQRSRAARGGMYGGAGGKALERYGQDYASGEYTNAFNRYMAQRDSQYNRLASLAGVGQTATQQVGNQSVGFGNSIGQSIMGAGNARASGYVGSANAINGGIGQAYNGYQNQQWLNYLQNRGLNNNFTPMDPYSGSGTTLPSWSSFDPE